MTHPRIFETYKYQGKNKVNVYLPTLVEGDPKAPF